MDIDILNRDRSKIDLIGQLVEVRWAKDHPRSERQCEQCVYIVRGLEGGLVCLELAYDARTGVHHKDAIDWVSVQSVDFLRVLTEAEAQHRVERLERMAYSELPRD